MEEKTRILIVEDEILIAHQLAAKLRRFGYEVVGIVPSGEEAIRESNAQRPHLVLMDIVIKGDMDGTEAGAIIQRDHGIPVIYLTAYADDATIAKAERSGAYGYVLKPFQEREVHAMIKLALNRHRHDSQVLQTLSVAEGLGEALRSTLSKVVLQVERSDRPVLESELAGAVDRNELEVFYQPQISLATGRIVGVEALLRWRHPERGLLAPGRFIPLAEESGLILPIGAWVLEQSAKQVKAWQARFGEVVQLSVNLSIRELRNEGLVEQVAGVLERTGLPAASLDLELTETLAMDRTPEELRVLERLKDLGVRLALDDFGMGYSALGYLHMLPFDALKIDRSFVGRLDSNKDRAAIIEAILHMARTLGLSTVAEGVETEAELAFLAARGCSAVQGFIFSPAVPAQEMEDALARKRQLALPSR